MGKVECFVQIALLIIDIIVNVNGEHPINAVKVFT